MKSVTRFGAIGLALFGASQLIGCAAVSDLSSTPSGRYAEPGRAVEQENQGRSSAVATLMASAERQAQGGQWDSSAATLERALRIEPRNAHLWQRLAAVRLKQGRFAQAESLAAKSNALGAGPRLQATNWRIIAEARRMRGDSEGARAAELKVATLEGRR